MTLKPLSVLFLLSILTLWGMDQPLAHAQICDEWPAGVEAAFCGRGANRIDCPAGFFCDIDPMDNYAVCLPEPNSNFCPPPPNLTGLWEGRSTCTSIGQGAKLRSTNRNSVLRITHIPNSPIRAEIDKVLFSGIAAALANSPQKGAVTLTHCGTDPGSTGGLDLISSANFNIGRNQSTMRGRTTWNAGNALTGAPRSATGGTCTFFYKRATTDDPGVAACP